jgi:enoyl-CoA hydratase
MTTVRRETIDTGITLLTLDRPDRLNAMNRELVHDLHDALVAVADDRECRVVILTGAGRGFCAGLDLKETGDIAGDVADGGGGPPAALRAQQQIATLVPRLRALPKPVIAAVNGPAAGGGLALALACDVRIAAESAKFNVAFIRVGLSGCDIGVSYLLPRLIGASRAFELMLTGRMVDAAEADRIGLVSNVVPDGQVIDAARDTAELVRANSPFGVWMTKEVMYSNLEATSLQAAIDLENRTQLLSSYTGDMREALAAFLEKRPPQFSGR